MFLRSMTKNHLSFISQDDLKTAFSSLLNENFAIVDERDLNYFNFKNL